MEIHVDDRDLDCYIKRCEKVILVKVEVKKFYAYINIVYAAEFHAGFSPATELKWNNF